jgi:hypothetical protein
MDWSTGGAQATLRRGVLWQLVEKLRLVVSAPGTSFPRRRESSDYLKHRPWNRTCAGMTIDFQWAVRGIFRLMYSCLFCLVSYANVSLLSTNGLASVQQRWSHYGPSC